MESVDVEGATGNVHTNYDGKATAAIKAFDSGADLVYVHVEVPDECGHRAETENKVLSIELIDQKILAPIYEYLSDRGEPFKIMVLPDHPTPIRIRTHSIDPVPFMIYSSKKDHIGADSFSEDNAKNSMNYVSEGHSLIDLLTSDQI
jgi:2,3-bisphosphoglycerate-independent phosphoglycerate mutase